MTPARFVEADLRGEMILASSPSPDEWTQLGPSSDLRIISLSLLKTENTVVPSAPRWLARRSAVHHRLGLHRCADQPRSAADNR